MVEPQGGFAAAGPRTDPGPEPAGPAPADPADCDGPVGPLNLCAVLSALADPGRLELVRALAATGEECCSKVGELAGLAVGKSTLSHHMRVLREAGVTRSRAQGTHRYESLRRAELDEAFPGLLDAVVGAAAPARAAIVG